MSKHDAPLKALRAVRSSITDDDINDVLDPAIIKISSIVDKLKEESKDIEDTGVLILTQKAITDRVHAGRKCYLRVDLGDVEIDVKISVQAAKSVFKQVRSTHDVYFDARDWDFVVMHLVEKL